jgi:hypothetical protein
MQPYVDIEGSGESTTRIKGSTDDYSGVVRMDSFSEIRLLTIENIGGGSNATAVYVPPRLDSKLTNMTVISSGAERNVGVNSESFHEANSSIKLTNVTINVSGNSYNYGVLKGGFEPYVFTMRQVFISVSGGVNSYGATVDGGTRIHDSKIKALIAVYNPIGNVRISNTMIDGSVSGPGNTKCAGVYDEKFTFYANTCP